MKPSQRGNNPFTEDKCGPFVVRGEPASKANSRRIVRFGNRVASIKSAKALSYVESFTLQCPKLPVLIEGPVRVEMTIWYASRRPDLDESVILDAMQGLIYVNDRQVVEKHVTKRLDRENPRAEILVRRLPDDAGTGGKESDPWFGHAAFESWTLGDVRRLSANLPPRWRG